MKLFFRVSGKVISTLLAIIVVLFLATLLPIPSNVRVLIVQSGSMEPALPVGSIIAIKQADEYKTGDIITFEPETESALSVTHRIVDVEQLGGQPQFITKGDANEERDPEPVSPERVMGKVLFDIPYVGYIITFARTPLGFFLIIILPLLFIALDEVNKIIKEIKKGLKKQNAPNDANNNL